MTKLKIRAQRWAGAQVARLAQRKVAADLSPMITRQGPSGAPTAVAASYRRRTGISQGALLQLRAFEALGKDVFEADFSPALRNPWARFSPPTGFGSVIVHASGPQIAVALNFMQPAATGAVRIGYCAWELPDAPTEWGGFDAGLHEVWTPSKFSADALSRLAKRPIRVVRHVVRPPTDQAPGAYRERLGLQPTDFVVVSMADVRSSFARKNPIGAIHAFRSAFANVHDAVMIVKVSGGEYDENIVQTLKAAAGNSRVIFLSGRLTDAEKWQLLGDGDVFLSLHRAEGYGLPMLEAMALGKAVVGTGWSGNLDFMDSSNSALVESKLVPVADPQGIYGGGTWAEPDLDHAVELLRRLRSDPEGRRRLGVAASASATYDAQLGDFHSSLAGSVADLKDAAYSPA